MGTGLKVVVVLETNMAASMETGVNMVVDTSGNVGVPAGVDTISGAGASMEMDVAGVVVEIYVGVGTVPSVCAVVSAGSVPVGAQMNGTMGVEMVVAEIQVGMGTTCDTILCSVYYMIHYSAISKTYYCTLSQGSVMHE